MRKRKEMSKRPQVEGLERKELMSGLVAAVVVGSVAQPPAVALTPSIPIPPPYR